MSEAGTTINTTNRWIPVIASIAMQLCMGTAYIWGVFQPEVTKYFGWPNATAALTFSFLLGTLTLGSMIGGRLQDKFRPQPVIIMGGLIVGLGFILTSRTTATMPWWMWLTYGVMGGTGMGMVYTTTIACCQKWFPDKRGLITGIIVAALGFGGIVFTPLAQILLKSYGVLGTFTWLGGIFIIVCLIGAQLVKNPPAGYVPSGWTPPVSSSGATTIQNFTPAQVLGTYQFYLVTIAFMLASMAGLMVIPFAKVLGTASGLNSAAATSGVMIIAFFNSMGRLFWGWISDRIGRKNTLLILTLLACVSILFVASAKMYMLLVLIGLVAFAYGGFLGTFPSITADYWGPKNMGMNYGMVMFGFGVGAVAASFIAGYLKDLTDGFTLAFQIASLASFIGFLAILILKPPTHKHIN